MGRRVILFEKGWAPGGRREVTSRTWRQRLPWLRFPGELPVASTTSQKCLRSRN